MINNFSHAAWSLNTNIYEVNIRQYTKEGTFTAFQKHLPRLIDMGVEILWFMPVTPISVKDRKGTLGSYYAVQNYTRINPEFGTMDDFNLLVRTAHGLGFKVIIDWVANHTGNDNIWIERHPDFFCYDAAGNILHPNGWEDVVKLNYENEKMQEAMTDAMKFWITESGIDGFRCDMAHLVPLEFWRKVRHTLNEAKPQLFWLAECEEPHYHEVFDATYTWQWMHITEEFSNQKVNLQNLKDQLFKYDFSFPKDALRIYFTSNHDENSWNGTEYEKYNSLAKALAVFSCTWNGIPMIYSGQELPNMKRLKFFDKDEIEWKEKPSLHNFYKTLLLLRKRNSALKTGDENVTTEILSSENDDKIFSFKRKNGSDEIVVVLNLSADTIDHEIKNVTGSFKNIFTDEQKVFSNEKIQIKPFGFIVLEKF